MKKQPPLRFDLLSLFPEYFQGPFSCSMIHQAVQKGLLEINFTNIRDLLSINTIKWMTAPSAAGPVWL